jgi:hypothetical protein
VRKLNVQIAGDTMTLKSVPFKSAHDGKDIYAEATWKRVE